MPLCSSRKVTLAHPLCSFCISRSKLSNFIKCASMLALTDFRSLSLASGVSVNHSQLNSLAVAGRASASSRQWININFCISTIICSRFDFIFPALSFRFRLYSLLVSLQVAFSSSSSSFSLILFYHVIYSCCLYFCISSFPL